MSPTTGAFASTTYTVGTGNMSVYNYQTGAGSNNPLAIGKGGAGTTHGVTTVKELDNTGRTADDLIGNIYNLNILVDGKETVGFLRNADYMKGNYSAAEITRGEKDFNIRDTHINSIDFASTAEWWTVILWCRNFKRQVTAYNDWSRQ